MNGRPWTATDIEVIRGQVLSEIRNPCPVIAKTLGRTANQVRCFLARNRHQEWGRILKPERTFGAVLLGAAAGKSDAEIATVAGVTRGNVGRVRRAAGIKPGLTRPEICFRASKAMHAKYRRRGSKWVLRVAVRPAWHDLADDPANLALANNLAGFHGMKLPHLRDAIASAAMLGLVDAARKFDPAAGVKFTTYATLRITGSIRDAMREDTPLGYRRKSNFITVKPLSTYTDDGYAVMTGLDDESAVGHSIEQEDEIARILRPLCRRDAAIVRRVIIDGVPQAIVGKEFGVCGSRICQIVSAAKTTLAAAIIGSAAHSVRKTTSDHSERPT